MLRPASVLIAAALISAGLSAGCSKRVSLDEALYPVTPELGHLGLSDEQQRAKEAINVDLNLRAMRDDLSRFWFFAEPSRLTPRAIP